ncbi:hypothetical protein [Burkholderia gladioli]|uniref:hypothetical protein n=1 Tax=Burkholderia gladioli TaxID=28095 RepID=UPI00139EDA16|nr:hypothetical protein LvStA_00111 [Burkholderia gladioli]
MESYWRETRRTFRAGGARTDARQAKQFYHAYESAVKGIETIVAEQGSDCDFRCAGKLKLAAEPPNFVGLEKVAVRLQSEHRTDDRAVVDRRLAFYGPLHAS